MNRNVSTARLEVFSWMEHLSVLCSARGFQFMSWWWAEETQAGRKDLEGFIMMPREGRG